MTHLGRQQLVENAEDDIPCNTSLVKGQWYPSWSTLGAVLVAELLEHVGESSCGSARRVSFGGRVSGGSREMNVRRGKATSEVWNRRPRSAILTERASTGRSGLSS